MQKKLRLILLVLVFALVLTGAYAGYHRLRDGVNMTSPSANVTPGEGFRDFTVFNENGEPVTLASLLGKPVIVNFWATWCPYCIQEFPTFQSAFETYGDRVQFAMVDATDGVRETVESASAFATENAYTFPVYFDLESSALAAYGIHSFPTTLFLAPDGSVSYQQLGPVAPETMEREIQKLLGE